MKLFTALALALMLGGSAAAGTPMTAAAEPTEPTAPAPSATATPGELVRGLYDSYFTVLNALDANPDGADPAWFDFGKAYFTPELNARIAKTQDPDGGPIDIDFLIGAQDFQKLTINAVDTTASDDKTATVRLKFSNMGTETTSELALVKQAEGWRINNITVNAGTADAYSLDQVLKDMKL